MIVNKWKRETHILWNNVKNFESIQCDIDVKKYYPRFHYTKGDMSIISPSKISNDMYELLIDWEISRYKTLKEAKAAADTLTIN